MIRNHYRGWNLTCNPSAPDTGVWKAERFGVSMCASRKYGHGGILRMIDQRIADETAEPNPPSTTAREKS